MHCGLEMEVVHDHQYSSHWETSGFPAVDDALSMAQPFWEVSDVKNC